VTDLDSVRLTLPEDTNVLDATSGEDRRWLTGSGVYVTVSMNTDDDAAERGVQMVVAGMLGGYQYRRAAQVTGLAPVDVPGALGAYCGTATIESPSGEPLGLLIVGAQSADHSIVALQVVWPAAAADALGEEIGSIVSSFELI